MNVIEKTRFAASSAMDFARSKTAAVIAIASAAAMSAPAQAAIDVTSVVAEIDDTIAPIGLIGAAVLLVVVAVAEFKWVRRAIS